MSTNRKSLRRLKSAITIVALFISVPLFILNSCVEAVSQSQRKIFNYSIPYYNDCVTSSSGGSIGNNTDYEGNQILTDEQMDKIKELQPFYQAAGEKYNVPWQMIAVVHLREHGLGKDGPSNGQGPYQDYERNNIPSELNVGGSWKTGSYTDEEFQIATDWAAQDLSNRAGGRDLNDDNVVKDVFFAYNGKAQAYIRQALNLGFSQEEANRGEGSPYVMNKADEKRDPNKNPNWGQIKTDGGGIVYPANQDYGAYVVYAGLGGGSGTSTTATKDTGTYIWTGDSRTVGMKNAVTGDDDNIWVAQNNATFDYFNDQAISEITKQLDNDTTIVFNFGVNDLDNIDKYINKLNELAQNDWEGAKSIIAMSVNPVIDGKNNASNSAIEEFNQKMKSSLDPGIKFVDTYSQLKGKLTESDFDEEGLHYTEPIYQEIYNMIRGSVTGNTVSCEGESTLTGSSNNKIAQVAKEWGEWGATYNACYVFGGGHTTDKSVADKLIAAHFTGGSGVDCSGFVSLVIYAATGHLGAWNTSSMATDTANFKVVDDPQPGDLALSSSHVEVITNVNSDGTFDTVGSHSTGCGEGKGASPSNFQGDKVVRYIGEGS